MTAVVCKISNGFADHIDRKTGELGKITRLGEEFRHRRWREIDTEKNQNTWRGEKEVKMATKEKTAIEWKRKGCDTGWGEKEKVLRASERNNTRWRGEGDGETISRWVQAAVNCTWSPRFLSPADNSFHISAVCCVVRSPLSPSLLMKSITQRQMTCSGKPPFFWASHCSECNSPQIIIFLLFVFLNHYHVPHHCAGRDMCITIEQRVE